MSAETTRTAAPAASARHRPKSFTVFAAAFIAGAAAAVGVNRVLDVQLAQRRRPADANTDLERFAVTRRLGQPQLRALAQRYGQRRADGQRWGRKRRRTWLSSFDALCMDVLFLHHGPGWWQT